MEVGKDASFSKDALRKSMKQQRRDLPLQDQKTAAESVAHQVSTLPEFIAANTIAVYSPVQGELDVSHIIAMAREQGKQCCLPYISDYSNKMMEFLLCDGGVKKNRYGIVEPLSSNKKIALCDINIIFMPVVAFDANNNRLGMGAGYYDRALECLGSLEKIPVLIGLAYDFQKVPSLAVEPYDIPMDIVLIAKGVAG